jgi:GNAT superfamily N-acetyltransferase
MSSVWTVERDAAKVMSAYVEFGHLLSTYWEVACISNEIVGFLFGKMKTARGTATKLEVFYSFMALTAKAILGQYGKLAHPLTVIKKAVSTEAQMKKHQPKSDAIVEFLVVDGAHRGKGIGRALMDRFVDTAKSAGAKTISLYTDELCNWGFYEKYGFKRWDAFDSDLNSYLANEEIQGFFYVLETATHTR